MLLETSTAGQGAQKTSTLDNPADSLDACISSRRDATPLVKLLPVAGGCYLSTLLHLADVERIFAPPLSKRMENLPHELDVLLIRSGGFTDSDNN